MTSREAKSFHTASIRDGFAHTHAPQRRAASMRIEPSRTRAVARHDLQRTAQHTTYGEPAETTPQALGHHAKGVAHHQEEAMYLEGNKRVETWSTLAGETPSRLRAFDIHPIGCIEPSNPCMTGTPPAAFIPRLSRLVDFYLEEIDPLCWTSGVHPCSCFQRGPGQGQRCVNPRSPGGPARSPGRLRRSPGR